MKVIVANREFVFSGFSITLYLVLMLLLIWLGFWQLGRAEQKQVFLQEQVLATEQTKVKVTAELDITQLRYRQTEFTGHYDSEKQYLFDNQIMNGQVGYFVMIPFKVDGLNQWVLVNRGWVLLNKDRRILPDVAVSIEKQTISGRINRFPVMGMRLKGAEIPTKGWPSVLQLVDAKILSKKSGYELLPFQVELDKDVQEGYHRDWKRKSKMPPEKHIAYAVQWFGLALTLSVLFIGFSRKVND